MTHIAVIGGGVSGLQAALHLQSSPFHITLIESSHRVGGWLQTSRIQGFQFEHGARTLRARASSHLDLAPWRTLAMITKWQDLLENILPADAVAARKRYVWQNGRFHAVNLTLPALWSSPLMRQALFSMLLEFFTPNSKLQSNAEDESIFQFMERHFGSSVAENLVSAMVHGIVASDAREISIEAMWPFLKDMERKHGSLLRSSFQRTAPNQALQSIQSEIPAMLIKQLLKSGMYSFQDGMESLPLRMQQALQVDLRLQTKCTNIEMHSNKLKLTLQKNNATEILIADHVIVACPLAPFAEMVQSSSKDLAQHLLKLPYASLNVFNLGFNAPFESVVPKLKRGFGYLIPPNQKTPVLGVTFDSCALKDRKNAYVCDDGTRNANDVTTLGVMMKPCADPELEAKRILTEHLHIEQSPKVIQPLFHDQCIPKYPVGYKQWKDEASRQLWRTFGLSKYNQVPRVLVAGAAWHGVSVHQCLESGFIASDQLLQSLASNQHTTKVVHVA